MRHGFEVRPNGNKIITKVSPAGFKEYLVFVKTLKGFKRTANGPWTYLNNARKDADQPKRHLKVLEMSFIQIAMRHPVPVTDSVIFTTGYEPPWIVSGHYRGDYAFHIQTLAVGEHYTSGHGTIKRLT